MTCAGPPFVVRVARLVCCLWLAAASPSWAASTFEFRAPAAAGDAQVPAAMRDLAGRVLPVYQEADPDLYLANLSALQMVAGDFASADASRHALRDRRRRLDAGKPIGRGVIFDIYAHARELEAVNKLTFADAFGKSFHETVDPLSDHDAYAVTNWFNASPASYQDAFQRALDQQRISDTIGQPEAVKLMWQYLAFEAFRSFGTQVGPLVAEDDRRRYTADDEVVIKTPDGASIAVLVVRPNVPKGPLPALLEFTIYDTENYARECAAHGYVGVVAYTRGKHTDSREVVPYEHDGEDARAVIDWIAKQPWSDARVGMYGNGYSGFTPWSAAKRAPAALKAIATSAASAPGIDVPMAGNIFQNSAYRWSSYVTDSKPAEANYYDDAAWRALDQAWYRSGRRYRDLGRLHGKLNPIFIRWLNHPSYDLYWQKMIPYGEQFAHINIPVLTITGYYAGSEPSALYYFTQHHRYNPHADHTLLIGPYDDTLMQRGPSAMLQRYEVDSAALIDVRELRYQWFDHVFKGAKQPTPLTDRVNFEVMGANEWRHAASLEAMSKGTLRFYLDSAGTPDRHRLSLRKIAHPALIRQTVGFKDRSDYAWTPPADFISRNLTTHNALLFVSDPMSKATEFNGQFSGKFDFTVNKMDVDLNITLYELTPDGDYIYLYNPTYELRASYARDRVHRHLLKAGERQELAFKSERLTSRRLQQGSRLVMILGISKRPDREINYGTGGDVSEESIADGKIPLKVEWHNDSYIDVPVRR